MLQEIKMKSTDFQPMSEFLLVKAEDVSNVETSNGGIIIQHTKSITQRPGSGTVIAVGKDCEGIEKGDYVVFPDTDGIDVKFTDTDTSKEFDFLLLRYKSVIGKKCYKGKKA